MAFSVCHWSGRLGNNIQQVANCIMAAEKNKTDLGLEDTGYSGILFAINFFALYISVVVFNLNNNC